VILHGDLHGYNLLVRDGSLRCVLDYDAISVGDHHYDLRYLPEFLVAVVDEYERRTAGLAIDDLVIRRDARWRATWKP
jgi:aminoglycoside phosphotransferase (APT) family kinase protein